MWRSLVSSKDKFALNSRIYVKNKVNTKILYSIVYLAMYSQIQKYREKARAMFTRSRTYMK